MKLRSVLILAGIFLAAALILLEHFIASQNYEACDITEINDIHKNIEKALEHETVSGVEKEYGCTVLLRGEEDYSNKLYTAIRNSDIILDYLKEDRLVGKIILPAADGSYTRLKRNLGLAVGTAFLAVLLTLCCTAFYLYIRILRPFRKLRYFAHSISTGDLELPLSMDRANYFGAFTESFDLMREELKKARQGEYEANISKKELVAQLSHDIKTPVSTIMALCELLEVKAAEEDVQKKLHTIRQKADVIDKLISNMFQATLEELEVLKIEPREEYSTILAPMLEDLNHYGRIHIKNELPECLIYCDRLRLNQVIDNVINNSYKYADTDIDITYRDCGDKISLEIRDYGSSMKEEDLPLVFGKYFRGSNSTSHSGSGLGLYLAKQFMKGMDGNIECSLMDGFIVTLSVKKAGTVRQSTPVAVSINDL